MEKSLKRKTSKKKIEKRFKKKNAVSGFKNSKQHTHGMRGMRLTSSLRPPPPPKPPSRWCTRPTHTAAARWLSAGTETAGIGLLDTNVPILGWFEAKPSQASQSAFQLMLHRGGAEPLQRAPKSHPLRGGMQAWMGGGQGSPTYPCPPFGEGRENHPGGGANTTFPSFLTFFFKLWD